MKKLELVISQAWQNQSKWLRVLAPVSALYGAVTYFRRYLYDKSVLPAYRASVPVLVVGNITVGGSGKNTTDYCIGALFAIAQCGCWSH